MNFLMNDQNIMFGYPPYKKTQNIEKGKSINFDECLKYLFCVTLST